MFLLFFPDTPLSIAGLVLSCQIYVNQTFHAKSAFVSLTKEKCNSAGINFSCFCLWKQNSSSIWTSNLPCKHFLQFFRCPSAHLLWPLLLCPVTITTLTCVFTAPSPAHELDFLLWQIVLLFCVTMAAFEMTSPQKSMLILPWPLQHYPTVRLHSKRTQEHPFRGSQPHLHVLRTMISHSRFTGLRTIRSISLRD